MEHGAFRCRGLRVAFLQLPPSAPGPASHARTSQRTREAVERLRALGRDNVALRMTRMAAQVLAPPPLNGFLCVLSSF